MTVVAIPLISFPPVSQAWVRGTTELFQLCLQVRIRPTGLFNSQASPMSGFDFSYLQEGFCFFNSFRIWLLSSLFGDPYEQGWESLSRILELYLSKATDLRLQKNSVQSHN